VNFHFQIISCILPSVFYLSQELPQQSSYAHGGGGGAATDVLLLHDLSRHSNLPADRALLEMGNMVGALSFACPFLSFSRPVFHLLRES
jgi:hypothetical protein